MVTKLCARPKPQRRVLLASSFSHLTVTSQDPLTPQDPQCLLGLNKQPLLVSIRTEMARLSLHDRVCELLGTASNNCFV